MTREPLIKLEGVTAGYDDGDAILRDVSLTVSCGDFILVTGPNGGGKTTLLRVLLKLIKPLKGRVDYEGRLDIGYLPQKTSIDQRFPITVGEVVASGMKKKDKERVRETLKLVGLEKYERQAIGELSGGQLQRALLARAIISRPRLLVLDEPLSYVDQEFEREMYCIIDELARDCTVIVVSHDQSTLGRMATRHIKVDRGIEECRHQRHEVRVECVD